MNQIDTKVPSLPRGDRNENPTGISCFQLISEDFQANGCSFLSGGFWALAVHRFGNWRMSIRSKLLRSPITLLYIVMYHMVIFLWGIKLDYTVKVGRRVCIEHFGGMILGARSIGDDVTIRQNTTFGIKSKSGLNCKPIIEDRVDIGCGACILGHVRVGHDSLIGANAVVIRDVPPFSIAVGVPAINKKRSDVSTDYFPSLG